MHTFNLFKVLCIVVIIGIKTLLSLTVCDSIYTVSQKNIPDIFDCNLKTNYQILIIFGTNISDTTCHQMTV